MSIHIRDHTIAHFGEGPHCRNFVWASTSFNMLLVKRKKNDKYDFSENRNLQLTFIAYMQFMT